MTAPGLRATVQKVPPRAWCVFAVGAAARYLLSFRGHNFDWDSYRLIAEIARSHENIYAFTSRFNYGPVWFWVIGDTSAILRSTGEPFRLAMVGALTLADAAIALLLWRRFDGLIAAIFFLNPISLIITGYHNQFDNVAIAMGLGGVVLYGDPDGTMNRRKVGGLAMLGVSLATKHVLFAFPLWIAFQEKSWRARLSALAIPVGLFLVSFAPFLPQGEHGIVHNVFLFKASDYPALEHLIVPTSIRDVLTPRLLFGVALVVAGWWWRRIDLFEALLLYLLVLVVFSPAASNQFLAIPTATAALYLNPPLLCFLLFSGLFLVGDFNGLHVSQVEHWLPITAQRDSVGLGVYDWPTAMLALGLVAIIASDPRWADRVRPSSRIVSWLITPLVVTSRRDTSHRRDDAPGPDQGVTLL